MKTARLHLRRFLPADWQDLFEYLSQEETVRFEPYTVFTPEQAREEALRRAENPAFWAVCLQGSEKVIGNICLDEQELAAWELGYVFNRDYQGQGYATEAAAALIDALFASGRARRIIARCNPLNTASWRLLERLQLRREAHFVKDIWFFADENGAPLWQDTYQYAILREEWHKSA